MTMTAGAAEGQVACDRSKSDSRLEAGQSSGVLITVRLELLAEKAGQSSAEGTEPRGRWRLPVAETGQLSDTETGRLQEVLGMRLLSLLVTGQLLGEGVGQLQIRWTGKRAVLVV